MGIPKEVAKNGLIMFAVGALLALAAPPLAQLIGPQLLGETAFTHALATPVLWTGTFFGAFGAIHAAVAPIGNFLFGDKPKEEAKAPPARESSQAPQIAAAVCVQNAQQVMETKHREYIHDRRAAEPGQAAVR